MGFGQHLLKGGKVGVFLEQAQASIGPMEHMVDVSAQDRSRASWHAVRRANQGSVVNK
jgi:hypothetical protein